MALLRERVSPDDLVFPKHDRQVCETNACHNNMYLYADKVDGIIQSLSWVCDRCGREEKLDGRLLEETVNKVNELININPKQLIAACSWFINKTGEETDHRSRLSHFIEEIVVEGFESIIYASQSQKDLYETEYRKGPYSEYYE